MRSVRSPAAALRAQGIAQFMPGTAATSPARSVRPRGGDAESGRVPARLRDGSAISGSPRRPTSRGAAGAGGSSGGAGCRGKPATMCSRSPGRRSMIGGQGALKGEPGLSPVRKPNCRQLMALLRRASGSIRREACGSGSTWWPPVPGAFSLVPASRATARSSSYATMAKRYVRGCGEDATPAF